MEGQCRCLLRSGLLTAGLLLGLSACGEIVGAIHPTSDVPGQIVGAGGDTTSVSLPDSALHGVGFVVTFNTMGGGCLQSAVSTDAVAAGVDTVVVRPVDRIVPGTCGVDVLKHVLHSASVTFGSPGRGVVRIIGAFGNPGGPTAILDRVVAVR